MKLLFNKNQRFYYHQDITYGAFLRLQIEFLKFRRELQKEIAKMFLFCFRKVNKAMIFIAKNRKK